MKRLALSISVLLFVLILGSGMSFARQIQITLTYESGKLVRTPPGPYHCRKGDQLVIKNNTGFDVLVEVLKADGSLLHDDVIGDTCSLYLPPLVGNEAEICYYYDPDSKGEITVCDELVISSEIPSLTEWGMIIFGLVLLGFITWVFLRRRREVVGVQ